MSKYPDVVSDEVLAMYSHISDDELARDIRETEAEVVGYESTMLAEREIAQSHPSAMERRLADFRATARPGQIAECEDLIAFLRRVQTARAGVAA